jgi:diadenosine tetraphosphate (Ap4A) HIT family hydrolase
MPDKFPICPGHTLIISKDHLACYGAAMSDLQRELEDAAAQARRFLGEAYGHPLLIWENGVSGQSVHHAHLHLMPMPIESLPADLDTHADVTPIDGWTAVGERYTQDGHYRYLELSGARRLLRGHTPALGHVVRMMSQATGLRYGHRGWIKTTTPDDVAEVARRFRAWRAGNPQITKE